MRAKQTTERVAGRLFGAVCAPAVYAHEVTHLVLAWPWASQLGLECKPAPAIYADWDDPPAGAVALAHYGPAVVGVVVAVATAAWVLGPGAMPTSTTERLTAVALALWWAVYTAGGLPGVGDGDGHRSDQQQQQQQ